MSGIMMATVASYVAKTNGSIQFNGSTSGAYATYAGGTGTAMGTGDFTWECFVYPLYNGNWQRYIDSGADNTFANGYQLGTSPLSYNPVVQASGTTFLTSSIAVTPNIWNHVAVTRSGTTVTIWVNGQSGGTATNSLNLTNQKIWIGADASRSAILFGNMSNIRIIKGTAIYTSTFTPPTQPLTAESGTQLLLNTYYDNILKDSSPNNFTPTNVNLVGRSYLNPFTNASYYTLASGTKAPVLGAGGQNPFPASSWTTLISTSGDDTFTIVQLPFKINFNNTSYPTYFPSSNFFITFGSGSGTLSVSASSPALNKISFAGADNSWQRVSQFPYFVSGTPTGTSQYLRLRVEGTASPTGTPGSPNMVYELTFFNPGLTGGVPWIELLVGQQARGTTGAFSAICSASAILTGGDLGPSNQGVSPNQSYVLVGDATGTSWTVNTGAYVGNSGY